MRSVKCTLDENEFVSLTAEAQRLGVHRSELIRSRIISAPKAAPAPAATPAPSPSPAPSTGAPSCSEFLDIVATLRKRMGNSIGRAQAEQATAIVLQCLHS